MDWINEPEEGVAPACGNCLRQLLLLRARGMHEEVPQSVLHVPFLGGRDELAFYRERRGMKWNGLPSRQPGLSPCATIASFTRTAAAAPSVLHRSALSAFSG